jgi:hypothetical protein
MHSDCFLLFTFWFIWIVREMTPFWDNLLNDDVLCSNRHCPQRLTDIPAARSATAQAIL